MRLIQLTSATIPHDLAIAAADIVLLRQDGCYLLRNRGFCQRYGGQIRALAQDVSQRQINVEGISLITDQQWVELCAHAQGVLLWR